MAKPLSTAPMPAPTDVDPTAAADTGDADNDEGDGPTVLLTVMDNHDGTYTLVKGDEDDGDADDAEPGEDAGGDDALASPEGDQGQTFDSPGALLKAILDILKEGEGGTGGSAQDNFDAGFAGGSSASPPKAAPIAQKY